MKTLLRGIMQKMFQTKVEANQRRHDLISLAGGRIEHI